MHIPVELPALSDGKVPSAEEQDGNSGDPEPAVEQCAPSTFEADPAPEAPGEFPAEEAGDAASSEEEGEEDGETASGEPGESAEGEEGEGKEAEEDDDGPEAPADAPVLPIASVVEAILFAAREPLKAAQIARAVGKGTRQEAVRQAVEELNLQYLETARAFEIAELSGRYQLMSRPEYVVHIMRLYPKREAGEKEKTAKLTPSALDTLSIIAYKQPVTRGEIERIRGVGCGPVLRALIERGTVRVAGQKKDVIGQPLLYGTTDAFLVEFGLGSLDELPHRSEFMGVFGGDEPAEPEPHLQTIPNPEAGAASEAESPGAGSAAAPVTEISEAEPAAGSANDDAAGAGTPSLSPEETTGDDDGAGGNG